MIIKRLVLVVYGLFGVMQWGGSSTRPLDRAAGEALYTRFQVDVEIGLPVAGSVSTKHASAKRLKIVAFGDSTTAFRKGQVDLVYSERLETLLKTRGFDAAVINSGVGGSHTGFLKDNAHHKRAHARDRFQTAVLDYTPDMVIMQFGINDTAHDEGPQGLPRISLEKYRENLEFMITELHKRSIQVVLMTPNALRSKITSVHQTQLAKYAQVVRDLAVKHKTTLVDIHSAFSGHADRDRMLLDGAHPNDKGHAFVAELIVKALKLPKDSGAHEIKTSGPLPSTVVFRGGENGIKQFRPNVVFVLIDDLGYYDLGCAGSTTYETPCVDRLAKEGMLLTDFYSAGPVCSPTRASILTGKYPARVGITRHLLHPDTDVKHNLTPALPTSEFTIGEAFKAGGYATGYFGKWHLGYSQEHWAGNQGFDIAIGGMDLPNAWKMCYPGKPIPMLRNHTRFFSPHHLTHMKDGPEGEYLTDRLTHETIKFIESHKDSSKPFFAFLSYHTVHTPLQVKPEMLKRYQKYIADLGLDKKTESDKRFKKYQNNPHYAAMVYHMDENVGRLMTALRRMNLEENTIVVFTSDNGGKGSVTSNLPFAGAKHDLREGGIRVPTIVRWPGKIKPMTVNRTPLISNDFYPTLLEMCKLPARPAQHLDGRSFADVLLKGIAPDSLRQRSLFWHYPHSRFEAAIREGHYKLHHLYKPGTSALYDLSADPGETTDLSKSMPELVGRMTRSLKEHLKRTSARFPQGTSINNDLNAQEIVRH